MRHGFVCSDVSFDDGGAGDTIGLDYCFNLLREAQRKNIHLQTGLSFGDKVFDACCIDRVLHVLDNPEAVVAEACRVLKSGGRLVAAEPQFDTLIIPDDEWKVGSTLTAMVRQNHGNYDIGIRLPEFYTESGLIRIGSQSITGELTNYQLAMRLLPLKSAIRRAVFLGLLTGDDVGRWHQHQLDLSQSGRCLV